MSEDVFAYTFEVSFPTGLLVETVIDEKLILNSNPMKTVKKKTKIKTENTNQTHLNICTSQP